MASVHIYLNFDGNCEEAFRFYETVFKTTNQGFHRYGEIPEQPGSPGVPPEHKNKILHTSLPINEHIKLMGADVVEGFGDKLVTGNNTYIMLEVASVQEAQSYFHQLSQNARKMEMNLEETFFAEQFSSFQDQFGVYWMIYFEGNRK